VRGFQRHFAKRRLTDTRETAAWENSTSYFPLLDRIAEGTFAELNTEQDLLEGFVKVLQDDGHILDPEALSSFKFALSLHAAAPRIEAHYQYYQTSVEPNMMAAQDAACPVWVHFDGKQYCSPTLERAQQDVDMDETTAELPFDRTLNEDPETVPSILYADITHPLFGQYHETVSKTAKEGRTPYRLRYRPPSSGDHRPLCVNGYGVELVLKRTDYIVIDDREAGANKDAESANAEAEISSDTPADLKPLTTSELATIGVNAASYIMSSADPLDALLKVSGNFPRYSSVVAGQNATEAFIKEFKGNRATFLPQGYNILWINGAQVEPRQINAFSLVEHLKKERALINQLRDTGLSASEAIRLLSHSIITQAQVDDEPQRYDWRDEIEGGEVIMWLNDIEKDKRYQGWPTQLASLLQRTFPGQLPTVRRDMHNLIIPVDLANLKELEMVTDALQSFIKRTVPVRFGLVPTLQTPESAQQAKIAYHILKTYGLGAMFSYFETALKSKKISAAAKSNFETSIRGRKIRGSRGALTYEDVLGASESESGLEATKAYLDRLALGGKKPAFLINGVALPRNDNWLEGMSTRVSMDLRAVQRGLLEEIFPEDTWIPNFFLFQATSQRNALIIPEDPKAIKILDLGKLATKHADVLDSLPRFAGSTDLSKENWAQLLVVADLDSEQGESLLRESIKAQSLEPGLEILFLHNPVVSDAPSRLSTSLLEFSKAVKEAPLEDREKVIENILTVQENPSVNRAGESAAFWQSTQALVGAIGFAPGEAGLSLNGRVIGPLGSTRFSASDIEMFLNFERSKRIAPVMGAITDLELGEKVASPQGLARLTSLVARTQISDVPEGIFESIPSIRMDKFNSWNSTYTAIHTSTSADPSIQIVAAIDPASELTQHWVPILKVLSELQGVDVKIFLNPRERLSELPVKRFYRHVLSSTPAFDVSGALETPKATFTGIPPDALLNLGMHVPPSWLVAPKECVYDLDNIKLNSLPPGADVDATYELQHILIEGHSRDVTLGPPPRGVQLLLGTEKDPHFADTIIMANLGYFQFKANPGYWHISLQPGRSSKIFNIDSVGSKGYAPQVGDNTTSVALLSFLGTTLFPRLSRKPGMENEDVLETGSKLGAAMEYLSKGSSFASSALSSLGLTKSSSSTNAEINIFSVASGHLYERMLNIMILSVMKNTRHSVKFWFIEQFLSPSFKSFLPHLAAHYNFQYEMVTYKWPHWLRAQKEKQREIWGYKILFLDVLFPLSLEKVIFVDADQIVRTDMMELNKVDLHGAPYGFTPMCDSRTEMEGFRFWKQGYWKTYLEGKPYHISALYVVDLKKFRELAAGDRLRQQYHALSADPASLSNLDQDLPNHMQHNLPIYSLPQEWLWCETWCSDESLQKARTIDLCNNPLTKEPKLERARRQVPEWTVYDEEIAEVAKGVRRKEVEMLRSTDDDRQHLRKIDEL
jgi:UDP-glucose:glycoprotein glucosyltransferase